MANVKRIYVEKKASFAVKARELEEDIKNYLGINGLEKVRIFIRYDVENLSDETFEKFAGKTVSETSAYEQAFHTIKQIKVIFENEDIARAWRVSRPTMKNLPLLAFWSFYVMRSPFLCVMAFHFLFLLRKLWR